MNYYNWLLISYQVGTYAKNCKHRDHFINKTFQGLFRSDTAYRRSTVWHSLQYKRKPRLSCPHLPRKLSRAGVGQCQRWASTTVLLNHEQKTHSEGIQWSRIYTHCMNHIPFFKSPDSHVKILQDALNWNWRAFKNIRPCAAPLQQKHSKLDKAKIPDYTELFSYWGCKIRVNCKTSHYKF